VWVTAARLLVILLAAAALGFYLGPYRERQIDEGRLAAIAAVIAGREVGISCPGTLASLTEVSPHAGSVLFSADGRPTDEAKLSSGTCARLTALLDGDVSGLGCLAAGSACPKDVEDAAIAVNVLSHEAWHLAGVRDEAVAQCYALQTNAEAAIRLGANRPDAEAIAAYVFTRIQPALPPEYRTPDCRDGGPLDLEPDRTAWP